MPHVKTINHVNLTSRLLEMCYNDEQSTYFYVLSGRNAQAVDRSRRCDFQPGTDNVTHCTISIKGNTTHPADYPPL